MPILPDEIVQYIKTFLVKCENCNKFFDINSSNQCTSCKISWCDSCKRKTNFIGYSYYKLYIMTCKKCVFQYNFPKMD